MAIINAVSLGIGIAGGAIIVWGVLWTFIKVIALEYRHVKGENICANRDTLRHHLGSYLLLGLEFLVAADIVTTIIRPTLQDLAVLGSIVIIRTILNFFLTREMASSHYCKERP